MATRTAHDTGYSAGEALAPTAPSANRNASASQPPAPAFAGATLNKQLNVVRHILPTFDPRSRAAVVLIDEATGDSGILDRPGPNGP